MENEYDYRYNCQEWIDRIVHYVRLLCSKLYFMKIRNYHTKMYYVNRKCLKVFTTLKSDKETGRFKRPGEEFRFEDYKFATNPLGNEDDYKHRHGVSHKRKVQEKDEEEDKDDDKIQGKKQDLMTQIYNSLPDSPLLENLTTELFNLIDTSKKLDIAKVDMSNLTKNV